MRRMIEVPEYEEISGFYGRFKTLSVMPFDGDSEFEHEAIHEIEVNGFLHVDGQFRNVGSIALGPTK